MATISDIQTVDDMRDLIATVLAGVAGGTGTEWRKLVGPVERLPTWKFVRFNWQVSPSGSAEQRKVIEQAVEVVRAQHPYVG